MEDAERIFADNPCMSYLYLQSSKNPNDNKAFFYTNIVPLNDIVVEEYNTRVNELKKYTVQKGIRTYIIKIPTIDDIKEEAQHKE